MINISILGATGSIGTQTLDVIRGSKEDIKLIGITANSSVNKIIEIIEEFKPKYVAMMDVDSAEKVKAFVLKNNLNIFVYKGLEGLEKIATLDEIDMVVTSVVGMIGLTPTIKAIEAKKDYEAHKENYVERPEILDFDLDYIYNLSDEECHIALQKFMGVGAKVADCVMLFAMEKHSAFPVDVWVKRAMIHFYVAPDLSLNKMRVFARDKFGALSGLAQQYLFYYARENKIEV